MRKLQISTGAFQASLPACSIRPELTRTKNKPHSTVVENEVKSIAVCVVFVKHPPYLFLRIGYSTKKLTQKHFGRVLF